MEYQHKERNGKHYTTFEPGNILIREEQDALDLMAICGEHDSSRMILHDSNLDPGFFDLKTRLAGNVFQKFSNYRMRCAIILPEHYIIGRFAEMVKEANRGGNIRFFQNLEQAESWISA